MTARRVVVTGQGVISSLGLNAEAHIEALRAGACGIGPIDLIPTENLTIKIAAEAKAFRGEGAEFGGALGERTATILGSSMGGQHTQDDNYRLVYGEGKTRVNHAIGQAFHLIRSGGADAAITGGAESGLTYGVLKAWEGLRVMSKSACRPFSKTRDGMVQGEGAAILVLEELEGAVARGATILGEIVGVGSTADAGDIVQPSLDGATRAMRLALSDGSVTPDQIDYINAHGTATAMNDRTECDLFDKVSAWSLHWRRWSVGDGGDAFRSARHRASDSRL